MQSATLQNGDYMCEFCNRYKIMKNNCESCAPKGREFFYSVKLVARFMNGDGYGGIDSESNPLKLVYCPECGRKISEVSADEQ